MKAYEKPHVWFAQRVEKVVKSNNDGLANNDQSMKEIRLLLKSLKDKLR